MLKTVESNFSEILPIIEEKLGSGNSVAFSPNGTSMLPAIKGNSDKVVIVKPETDPKKNDVVFYRRKNGVFVLHRIIKFDGNEYTMCGDNQFVLEKGIEKEQIIASVKEIIRDGKSYEPDKFPSRFYVKTLFLRRFFKMMAHFAVRLPAKLIGK